MCFWLPFLFLLGSALLAGLIGYHWRKPRIDELEGEIKSGQDKYVALNSKYDGQVNEYAQLNNRHTSLMSEKDDLAASLTSWRGKYDEAQGISAKWESDFGTLQKESESTKAGLESQLQERTAEVNQLTADLQASQSTASQREGKVKDLEAEVKTWKNKYESQGRVYEGKIQEWTDKAVAKDKSIGDLEAELEKLRGEKSALETEWTGKYQDVSNQLSAKVGEVETWSGKYAGLENTIRDKDSEIEELRGKVIDWEGRYNTMAGELKSAIAEKEEWSSKHQQAQQKLSELEGANQALQSKVTDWESKYKTLEAELQGAITERDGRITKQDGQISDLEARIKAMEEQQTEMTKNHNQAMQAAEQSRKELDQKIAAGAKDLATANGELDKRAARIKVLEEELARKPKEVIKEVTKEVEVIKEVVKEFDVIREIDEKSLYNLLSKAATSQISRKVIGTKRKEGKAKVSKKTIAPAKPVEKRGSRKDNLTKIHGVGPKINKLLNKADIWTFEHVSEAKMSTLQKVLDDAGQRFQMHDPKTWPAEARKFAGARDKKAGKKVGGATGPKQIEITREVPVEITQEVEIIKSFDLNQLAHLIGKAETYEVSKRPHRPLKKRPAPPKVKKPVVAKKDDLKKVEGIGPKIAGLLNADGIMTFSQLSEAKVDRLKRILDDAGSRYRMHDPTTWPQQADLAATGKWDELKVLQDKLDGGRS